MGGEFYPLLLFLRREAGKAPPKQRKEGHNLRRVVVFTTLRGRGYPLVLERVARGK